LFESRIEVDAQRIISGQAVVFFGREKTLGIRVVLKQYKAIESSSFLSEIKIFSHLEKIRNERAGNQLANMLARNYDIETMPLMLGYKYSKDVGEILMTHGGNDLKTWLKANTNRTDRVHLAADFLRQIIIAVKTLHSFGCSHGDLKPENICVRR